MTITKKNLQIKEISQANIAIVGAGFSGLAICWFLFQKCCLLPGVQVTLFDPNGIGGGASGISAGLLHPFSGQKARLNHLGLEGFDATVKLLRIAEEHLGHSVADYSGILRPALSKDQEADFSAAALQHPERIKWISAEESICRFPGIVKAPGICIQSGMTVYPQAYLQGLWLACQKLGAVFMPVKVYSLKDLADFDQVVIASGAETTGILELADFPIRKTKGQILELNWPCSIPPLPMAINSQIYCTMDLNQKHCLAGATYEKTYASLGPDLEVASRLILPGLAKLYPPLSEAKVISCRAGVRASTPSRLPIIKRINSNCWVLAGMGSKGLLYHALYAKKLVSELVCFF